MSIEVISTRSFADLPGPACRACGHPPHISFNWQYSQQHEDHELHALVGQLKQVKRLKFGELYACQSCGRNWVLDADGYAMTRVPPDRRDLLNEWNGDRLSIDPAPLRVLDAIGGTVPRYTMGHYKVVAIPCAISTRSGERIDPAIVWITQRPPIDLVATRVRLYRGIAAVEPSRFALPMEVRRATVLAGEVAMGFAPTHVVAANGTPFVLHWATSLFHQNGITGSEIRLSKEPFQLNESITIAETDFVHATYFYADWFDRAGNLDRARPEGRCGSRLGVLWRRLFASRPDRA